MIDTEQLASFAGQLLGCPCYIVTTAGGAPQQMPGALAWTGRELDLCLRQWLESTGRWHGRRPAIAFNDTVMAAAVSQAVVDGCGERETVERELVNASLVHELAHVAEKGIDRTPPTEKSEQIARGFAALSGATLAARESDAFTELIRTAHGPEFARLACHVHYRARQIGCHCPLEWVCDSDYFRLPPIEACDSALCNEPESLTHTPLLEIKNARAPTYFQQLFENERCEQ